MKKMVILIGLIIVTNVLSAYSQTLQNTTWSMQDSTGKILAYCRFGSDTLSFKDSFKDDNEYFKVSVFQINGNKFSIIDLPGNKCPTDTGKYTYLIQNDTLEFTVINDICSQRLSTLVIYFFVRYQTGIQITNNYPVIQLYPNPANDEITIESNHEDLGLIFSIFDQLGTQVFSGTLTGESTIVDINQLSSGLYFIQIGGNNKQIFKLIKK